MTDREPASRARLRAYEEAMAWNAANLRFVKEADEVINMVFDNQNSATRQRLVAEWLNELVAAASFGCTGITADPSGPELLPLATESDSPGSGAKPRRSGSGSYQRAVEASLERFGQYPPPLSERDLREGVIPDLTDEEVDGFLDERELGGEG